MAKLARCIALAGLAGGYLLVGYAQEPSAPALSFDSLESLEARGVRIANIRIVNRDVFDTTLQSENRSVFRLANALHIETRPSVIRRQLLF